MDELISIMNEIGLPFAYSQFAEGEAPNAPFCIYLIPRSDNFGADGRVYFKIGVVNIELYTYKKDLVSEGIVESVLDTHEIFYNKEEIWIESERLYEVVYSFEMKGV